jgi:hypothetical protein
MTDRREVAVAIAGVLGWHFDDTALPQSVRDDHNTVITAAREWLALTQECPTCNGNGEYPLVAYDAGASADVGVQYCLTCARRGWVLNPERLEEAIVVARSQNVESLGRWPTVASRAEAAVVAYLTGGTK